MFKSSSGHAQTQRRDDQKDNARNLTCQLAQRGNNRIRHVELSCPRLGGFQAAGFNTRACAPREEAKLEVQGGGCQFVWL